MSRSIHHRRFNSVGSRSEARRRAVRAAVGCALESLETRQLFSVLTVNTTADDTASDGQLSLREAIALIQNNGDENAALGRSLDGGESAQVDSSTDPFGTNDTIVFDNSIAGQTIYLGSAITISSTMVIDGGTSGMTLSGSGNERAFSLSINGDLTLNHLTITNFSNRGADGVFSPGDDGYGGAIFVDRGTLTITDSTLANNSAIGGDGDEYHGGNAWGGAIYISQGALTLSGITLSNNSATGGYGDYDNGGSAQGGAIFVDRGTLTITDGTLSDNATSGGEGDYNGGSAQGGAIFVDRGTLTITNTTLANNSTSGGEGGTDNGVAQGGAIYVTDGNSTLSFSTVSSNGADDGGRGLYVSSSGAAVVQIDNSILGQADNSVADVVFSGTVTASGSNNLIRNATVPGVTSLSSADPKLGPLQYNGGPTRTMRPATDSPAIDAADDNLGGAPSTDQRGLARPAGAYDIGALELTAATLTVTGTDDDDTRDSVLTLREAFRLIDGRLDYNDLTVDEQAQITGTLADVYFVHFDSSLAGATFYLGTDDSLLSFGPTAFTVYKTVTITGLDDVNGDHITLANDAPNLRLFLVTATGNLTLENLSIQDFTARGADDGFSGENAVGGAIHIDGGAVTIDNSDFRNNRAVGGWGGTYGGHVAGGAIYSAGGNLTIHNSEFHGNLAIGGEGQNDTGGNARGGAIYIQGGALSLGMVTFDGNEATGGLGRYDGGGAYGGAFYADGTTVTAQFLAVANNRASGGDSMDGDGGEAFGGGIYATGGDFDGTLVVLVMNYVNGGNGTDEAGDAHGGAAFVENGTFNLNTFAIIDNHAFGGGSFFDQGGYAFGGALAIGGGIVTLTGGQITGNSAVGGDSDSDQGGDAFGGAIDIMLGADLTLVNATIAQNTATAGTGDNGNGTSYGGAIHTYNSDLTINFSTISANHADDTRGVMFEIDFGPHLLAIDNSILGEADDSDYDLVVAEWGGTLTQSGSHNLIRVTDATGIGIVSNADPRLAPLGNYGGMLFQTMALLPDSPALDAGGSAGPVAEDQRGANRVYNGTADIGAFESQGYTLSVDPDSTGQSAVAGDAFGNPLTVTLTENFDNAPIPGATIQFADNGSGPASATFAQSATTDIDGHASVTATANDRAGSYTITASLGGPQDETGDIALTNTAVAPAITSANSTTFITGMTGTFTITTTGTAPVTLSYTGTLPSGVTFVDNGDGTATISGMLGGQAGGTYVLTITAQNDGSPDATQTLTLTVNQAPSITSADSASLIAGSAGTFTITTAGIPAGTLTKSGSLPSGVTFHDNGDGTATLSGTPALGTGGTYTLTISADNGVGSIASQTLTLYVHRAPSFTSATSTAMTAGTAANFTITTAGFPAAAISTTASLPAGLTLVDNGDGTATLSGTPADGTAGAYVFTLSAYNGVGSAATQVFTLTINAAPVSGVTGTGPTITSPATLSLIAGQAASFTVTTTGSPIATLHVTGTLPAGVTFVDNGDGTGTFSGTPAAAGNYTVSIVANNGVGDPVTQSLAITVNAARPIIVSSGYTSGGVRVNNADGTNRFTISSPFKKGVGVRLASADMNGDGVPDIIMAAGTGAQPQVVVYDGVTGQKLASVMAFGKSFTGGLFVAAADVDHDGTPDLVVGQGVGGTSKVRVFSGKDQSLIAEFSPLGNANAAGARVAAADLNGDGFAEIVVGQGFGNGNAVARIFDGRALTRGNVKTLATLSKADVGFAGGAFVATGDVNGDGTPDVVVSQSDGTRPYVAVFNGKKLVSKNPTSSLVTRFRTASDNGLRIASYDVNGDGYDDILTSATVGTSSIVKIFSGADGSVLDTIENEQGGKVFVG